MSYFLRIILIIVWLYPSLSNAQAHIRSFADWSGPIPQKHGLKGRVKTITQVQSPITYKKTDWLDGHSGQNYSKEYTKQGLLQKQVSRNDFNEPDEATYYEYTSPGKIRTIRSESLDPNPLWGRTEGQIDYGFDPVKKVYIVWDKRIIMGEPLNKRVETFVDSSNRFAIQREYRQDTLLLQEKRYQWDTHGYITEFASRFNNHVDIRSKPRETDFDSFLQNELAITLSESEKKMMQKSLDSLANAQDSLQKMLPKWSCDTVRNLNQYNKPGRLTESKSYSHNQITHTVSFAYHARATRVVHQSYDQTGKLISETISLQHPVRGYILSDSSRSRNGEKWESRTFNDKDVPRPTYHYRYDAHGNWIEQRLVDATGKQTRSTLIRTIDYYP